LNNLLLVILNHAVFAADAAPDDDAIQYHIAQIRSASERAVRLTRLLPASAPDIPVLELLESVARERLTTAVVRGRGTGQTILLVQDEAGARAQNVLVLERNGYIAVGVASGSEALSVAGCLKFDLLLTDAAMPTMSGRDLVAKLARRGLASPVLYLSEYADAGDGGPGKRSMMTAVGDLIGCTSRTAR
jgi:CheY-like chemotaxis protein